MRGDRVRTSQAQKWPAPVPLPGAAYPDWEAIYADNIGRIYRLMFSKVANRPDAEDLTSQVFLAAYGPLRATAEVAQVRAYLTATARTVLAEHWRRTLGHQVTEIDLETTDLENFAGAGTNMWAGSGSGSGPGAGGDGGTGTDGAHAGGGSSADERTARILEALPQRQRQILILRFLRGYSIRQAATELGVTVANAKVMQHRALRAAARMEDSGGDRAERAGGLGTSEESGLRWGSGRGSGRESHESGQGRRQEPGRESQASGQGPKRELGRESDEAGQGLTRQVGRGSEQEPGQGLSQASKRESGRESGESGRGLKEEPGQAPGRELQRGPDESGVGRGRELRQGSDESRRGLRQESGRELRRGTGSGSGTGTGSGSGKSGDSSKQAQAKEAAS